MGKLQLFRFTEQTKKAKSRQKQNKKNQYFFFSVLTPLRGKRKWKRKKGRSWKWSFLLSVFSQATLYCMLAKLAWPALSHKWNHCRLVDHLRKRDREYMHRVHIPSSSATCYMCTCDLLTSSVPVLVPVLAFRVESGTRCEWCGRNCP